MELARASAVLNSDRGDDEKVDAIKLIRNMMAGIHFPC
jgi:hypothetical protein